jgi:glycosyltransferase involved in cell wall biosynthesis
MTLVPNGDPAAKMRRVAIFLPSLGGGGAERAMVNLANGMHELGCQVDFVVATATGPYQCELEAGIRLVDLQARRVLQALPGLVRYLRSRRPVCLYSALDHANLVALWARGLARTRTRVVLGLRNTLSQERMEDHGLKMRSIVALARRFYPGADGFVAVSRGVAEDAAATIGLCRDRIIVIPNPVLTPDLAQKAAEPLDHPWFGAGEPPVILACGRLAPQKDLPTLLAAFAEVRRRRPARLVILGEGELRGALQRRAEVLAIADDVAMLGFDPNPFRYMARARVFALSSIHEGSPNVLVQALACGCRVVATDCPGGPRDILDGLPGTRLVPIREPSTFAKATEELMTPGPRPSHDAALRRFDYLAAARSYLALERAARTQ